MRGHALPAGHFLAEERPDAITAGDQAALFELVAEPIDGHDRRHAVELRVRLGGGCPAGRCVLVGAAVAHPGSSTAAGEPQGSSCLRELFCRVRVSCNVRAPAMRLPPPLFRAPAPPGPPARHSYRHQRDWEYLVERLSSETGAEVA